MSGKIIYLFVFPFSCCVALPNPIGLSTLKLKGAEIYHIRPRKKKGIGVYLCLAHKWTNVEWFPAQEKTKVYYQLLFSISTTGKRLPNWPFKQPQNCQDRFTVIPRFPRDASTRPWPGYSKPLLPDDNPFPTQEMRE